MPVVTVSSKNQITLPVEIVRAFDIKPGEKLIIEGIQWRIVMMKESENRLERYVGSLRGLYGNTVEEIDQYIRDERASPERDQWKRQFYDIIQVDPIADSIVTYLLHCDRFRSDELRMFEQLDVTDVAPLGIKPLLIEKALGKLFQHGGVRRVEWAEGNQSRKVIYVVPEIAHYLRTEAAR